MTPLVVIGAGGFGREALDVIAAINRNAPASVYELLGVVDTHPSQSNLDLLQAMGVAWLGSEAEWLASGVKAEYIIGIGSPKVRERISETFDAAGLVAATVIHPRAIVGSLSTIGAGAVVCSGAQISTNVTLGAHVHVNPNATIGHDSVVSDCVSINPGAVLSGDVSVERGVLIGAGAIVLQGLTVGQHAVVGAAACVVRNVDPHQTVKGIPAR
jgi:sugar O-acyltransferase (sialic acid O-acetyltransferase NeuD family)